MNSEISIYKLTYAGKAKKLYRENLINNFTLFDILLINYPKQRRVYIWIGKKASQNLKTHIPRAREILSEYEPNLTILRNITIESGFETPEFLELLEISKFDLQERLKSLEMKFLPLLSEINKLKESVDNAFIAENYEAVIKIAEKIRNIATQVNDTSLEEDQINLIDVAKSRHSKNELITQIESEAKKNIDEFNQLIKIDFYQEAHKIVSDFKNKYETSFNLYKIPIAQELLIKDENLKYSLKPKEENIKKTLEKLEFAFESAINERDILRAKNCIYEAKKDIIRVINENIIEKWNNNEKKLLLLQESKLQEIYKYSNIAIEYIDKGEFEKALKYYLSIIKELRGFQY